MENKNLIKGSISKGILSFMLPLIGSSLIQQLYSTVDLIIVGRFLGAKASASIGASNLIITCLIGFFNGMAVGTGVITSHSFGLSDDEKLKKIVSTSFLISIVGGIILSIIGVTLSKNFLIMMDTPNEILNIAVKYLKIYMFSMISIVTYNLCSGIVRAMGDSKSPMKFQLIGGFINVIADIVFIIVLKKGVEGAAIATFLSQTIASILVLIYLHKRQLIVFKKEFLVFHKGLFCDILKIGIPTGIQSIAITLSNIIIQAKINHFGVYAIAAFTAYFKIELILYIPIIALGQAIITFMAQNIGANQYDRSQKGLNYCVIYGAIITFIASLILLILSPYLFSIFSAEKSVISYGIEVVKITFPFYFLYVILESFSSAILAFGKAIPPMIIILTSFCGLRIVLLIELLKKYENIKVIASTYPISWAIAALGVFLYYKIRYKKTILLTE